MVPAATVAKFTSGAMLATLMKRLLEAIKVSLADHIQGEFASTKVL